MDTIRLKQAIREYEDLQAVRQRIVSGETSVINNYFVTGGYRDFSDLLLPLRTVIDAMVLAEIDLRLTAMANDVKGIANGEE